MVKKSLTDFVAYVNKIDIEYTPKVNAYLAKLDDQLYSFLSRFIKIKKLPHTRLRPGILINLEKISQSSNEAHLQFMRDMQQAEQQSRQIVALNEASMQEGVALNEAMARETMGQAESMSQSLAEQDNSNWGAGGFGEF